MKILIATGLYPPDIGGPATYTVFLEKHAREIGIELVVVPFGVVRKYPPIIRHLVYLFLLILRSRGCMYLFALDTVSVGIPTRLASIMTRTPYLLRVPGDYAWEQGQQRFGVTETLDVFRTHTPRSWRVRLLSRLQTWVARGATHIVVPSEYMKGLVTAWGVPRERVTRIYSVLHEMDNATPASRTSHTDTFCITTSARLVPWKGIDTLIAVVASLVKDGVPVHLNVYGDGIMRTVLEAQVRTLGVEAAVTFHGAVSREVLARALTHADVFVLNTSYEGLSHQLLEVMSIGVPIVTTPVGGNCELIEHEQTGLFVPYNDREKLTEALIRLREDPHLGRVLGERARAKVSVFSEGVIVGEWRTFFEGRIRHHS